MTEWMVVYSTYDLVDAQVIVGRLEVEGIKSFIQRESLGAIIGITYGGLGGVHVLVNPEDYASASAILEPDELATLSDDNDDTIYYHNDLEEDDESE